MKIKLVKNFNDVISAQNLLEAWQEFLKGKRGKKDVQYFATHLMDNILELHHSLVNRTYQHGTYESFFVNDPKRRHIHKASVRDRLLHHAVYRILYPFFDQTFIFDSYSCRNGKGTHKAINRFRALASKVSRNYTRTCWVLKCDIKKFFASLDHQVLLSTLKEYIPDQDILWLLQNIIESFYTVDVNCHSHNNGNPDNRILDSRFGGNDKLVGLPLGNLTSQLFANVYMNRFDQWVKHKLKAKHYARYADDFVFIAQDKKWLDSIIPQIEKFLMEKLRLHLHPTKLFIKTIFSGVDFLGWVNFPDHRILRATTRRRMFARIKINPTEETLRSYLGMLGHGNTHKLSKRIRQ